VPEAQYNLAVMYLRGEGVPRDLYRGLTGCGRRRGRERPAQKAVGRHLHDRARHDGAGPARGATWLGPVAAAATATRSAGSRRSSGPSGRSATSSRAPAPARQTQAWDRGASSPRAAPPRWSCDGWCFRAAA
jgi:TPR repeat protein